MMEEFTWWRLRRCCCCSRDIALEKGPDVKS
ncbi:hypothetical protein KSS87_018800 [Heliosperma pusillum]|nr:hypothetical protein KSS87_018800 [Heliosperma pusillum]